MSETSKEVILPETLERPGRIACLKRWVEVSMPRSTRQRVPAFCPLCASRCGCEAVVEDGRLVAIEPDPAHPTGKALCAKGRASPALVEAPDRLIYPIRPPVRRVTLIGAGDTSPGELQPIRIGRNGFS